MERAAHIVSSHNKDLPQYHSKDLVTLARVTAHQVNSDIQWGCKDVPLEAWVACHMAHRYFTMCLFFGEIIGKGLQLCFNTLFTLLDGLLWTAGPWRV